MKKLHLKLLTASSLLCAQPLLATVVITEFMANPSGSDTTGEYIELYNSGASSVDLTGWILSDEDSDSFALPAVTIGAGNFIVLASDRATFISDWGIPSGLQSSVIDANFTLTNTSDEVELENGSSTLIWSLAYASGNVADGSSAYLDPATPLASGTAFGSKAAPGVDLNASGDYINQSFLQEAEASAQSRGIGSPFAWNGINQIPEPHTGLLFALAATACLLQRHKARF